MALTSSFSQVEEQTVLPSVLLDDLQGLCMAKTQDWWTYEVCYQQHVSLQEPYQQLERAVCLASLMHGCESIEATNPQLTLKAP